MLSFITTTNSLMPDAGTTQALNIGLLHNEVMIILVFILTSVTYLAIKGLSSPHQYNLTENVGLELFWTTLPAVILVLIAFPSLILLYLSEDTINSQIDVKVVGNQWYWNYNEVDSYMTPTTDLVNGQLRLIQVDYPLHLPINTHIKALVTSTDVIHSFSVPALGIKVDAIPGRLNQVHFLINRGGLYVGHCSEICGANHSFMPINIEAEDTLTYLNSKI